MKSNFTGMVFGWGDSDLFKWSVSSMWRCQ